MNFTVKCENSQIIIPKKTDNPKRLDNLWEQTCFELLIAENNKKEYFEFNFSPSGYWNAFVFDDYRENKREDENISEIRITTKKSSSIFEINSEIILLKGLNHS